MYRWIVPLAVAVAVAAGATPSAARDQAQSARTSSSRGDPRSEAVKRALTPGENHKRLDYFIGDWRTESTTWLADADPVKSEGTCHFEWAMGGRYLRSTYASMFIGQPFEGMGIDGYDNVAGEYFGLWIDNMGTGYLASSGQASRDGKAFTYTGTSQEAGSRKRIRFRIVRLIQDSDSFVLQMYSTSPGGRETKVLQIRHVRVKTPPPSAGTPLPGSG